MRLPCCRLWNKHLSKNLRRFTKVGKYRKQGENIWGAWEKCRKLGKQAKASQQPQQADCIMPSFQILEFAKRQAQSYHGQPAMSSKLQPPTKTLGYAESLVKSIKLVGVDRFGDLPRLPRMSDYPNVVTTHPLAFSTPHSPSLSAKEHTGDSTVFLPLAILFSTYTHTCFHPYLIITHWRKASQSSCCLVQRLN